MNKALLLLEIIGVIIAIIIVLIVKVIPEYENSLGSSEKLFTYGNYKSSVEVKIETGPEFLLIINEDNQISNIFFENEQSTILANKEIETKDIPTAISLIVQILIENNEIENKKITIINYGEEKISNQITTSLKEALINNNISSPVETLSSTLQEKAQSMNIEETETNKILWSLYEISYQYMENTELSTNQEITLTKEQAISYMDNIYQKLQTYMINKNIKDQARDDLSMPIQYIPGDTNNEIYPKESSWYYIEDYKIYAEITLSEGVNSYTYCYPGSLEEKKEGMCP